MKGIEAFPKPINLICTSDILLIGKKMNANSSFIFIYFLLYFTIKIKNRYCLINEYVR